MSKKRSSGNGVHHRQELAMCDDTSLGNLLIKAEIVDKDQLLQALQYQQQNADEMLGEILIKLGHLERSTFEHYMRKQNVIRNGYKKTEVMEYVEAATKRTFESSKTHDNLTEAAMRLAAKLTKIQS